MTRYVLGSIGLAVFAAGSLLVQSPACGEEAGCCPTAGCCGQGCGDGCCKPFCERCPRCGCNLQPVCQVTCDTKKETIHKYGCTCKYICLPPVTPICGKCNECCENNGNCCEKDCHCMIRAVNKLLICPATKETPVKKCTVCWVCPSCGCQCDVGTVAPAAPAGSSVPAPAPAPAPQQQLPPPPKTTEVVPLPPTVAARDLQGF